MNDWQRLEVPAPVGGNGGILPLLDTRRLVLRQPREEDGPALFEIFSDPEVTRYWSWETFEGPAQGLELVREIGAHAASGTLLQWGIAPREAPERLVGTCTLASIDPVHRRASLGFAVLRSHWGRGIAGEAADRVVQYAFETLGCHRLSADVDPRNTASLRVLERLGFQREGYLRENYWQSAEWQDAILLGLLRRDWESAR